MYRLLVDALGPQNWWPADTPTEMVIGAILTQNTAWTNVVRAIANLRQADSLCFAAIHRANTGRLGDMIQPSGTYRVKAKRLKAIAAVVQDQHQGSLTALLSGHLGRVRTRLLAIHGIGPETADAILLYAGGRPTFVVDAYTKRVLRRHLLIHKTTGYDRVQAIFRDALTPDAAMFNEYHALLVELGKRFCRTKTDCADCPLAVLPHDETL